MIYWTEIDTKHSRHTGRHLPDHDQARRYAQRWLERHQCAGEVRLYRYDTDRHITNLIDRYRYDGRRPEGPPDAA